ncbi:Ribosomal lysine N-methyltransferase 3 [Spathaspora sp. JA1]|nr:Ribosomal lysine N-methyltransferase 3 [Spathaspora sp. JA1]
MSSTFNTKVDSLVQWLDKNSHWREDLIIKESKFGGSGVFYQAPDTEDDDDPILLRIPKTNLLAPKNSFIFNLLDEYEPINPEIDISQGIYGLVISFIYEHSIENNSPWFEYIESMDIENSEIPICLWDESDKANLKHTEVDLLNMLDPKDLINFYIESLQFANLNQQFIEIPSVFDIPRVCFTKEDILNKYNEKLIQFGKLIQTTISRAFDVDNYYGLSLVPGADIFNHIEPKMIDGVVQGRENIHFVCDANVCDICGEGECEHEHEEDIEGDIDEDIEERDMEDEGDIEEDADSEEESSEEEGEHIEQVDEEEEEEEVKELTMDYIYQLEQEIFNEEEDTDLDPEEVSTISDEEEQIQDNGAMSDLAQELSDGSKCCDVLLIRRPETSGIVEIFNSYGNELANCYLLQKYGFITEDNINDTCILSVEFFKYLKDLKGKVNSEKRKEIENKIAWLETIGYDLINQIVESQHEHEHACQDEDCEDDNCNQMEYPESWPLSIRIKHNGECTIQTYAILKLLDLKNTTFKYKLLSTTKQRELISRISKLILQHTKQEFELYNKKLSGWCQQRIESYPNSQTPSKHSNLINCLKQQEIKILKNFIDLHS